MFEVNDPRYNEIYHTYYDTRHDDNDFLHNVFMKSILNIINSLRTVPDIIIIIWNHLLN